MTPKQRYYHTGATLAAFDAGRLFNTSGQPVTSRAELLATPDTKLIVRDVVPVATQRHTQVPPVAAPVLSRAQAALMRQQQPVIRDAQQPVTTDPVISRAQEALMRLTGGAK